MYNWGSDTTVVNCTFSGNSAGSGGGGMYNLNRSSLTVTNCIFWKNTNPSEYDEIDGSSMSVTFNHCTIRNSGGSGDLWDSSLGIDGGGNIGDDPMFIDEENPDGPDGVWLTADDGLALGKASPCINTGDPASATEFDILGNPRAGTADMGAYEYIPRQNGVVSWVFYH